MSSLSTSVDGTEVSSSNRPVFPPELLNKIFRDSVFSRSDLAKLALVSKSFLPSVRNSLYQKIVINHAGTSKEPADDLGIVVESYELLKLLERNRELAELVEEVGFRWKRSKKCRWIKKPGSPSREETVDRVLKLAVNLKRFVIKYAFGLIGDLREVLERNDTSKITHVEDFGFPDDTAKSIKGLFPSVKSLKWYSPPDALYLSHRASSRYPQCEHLAMFAHSSGGAFVHPILRSSESTLTTLEISHVAIRGGDIKFDQLPRLKTLHVIDMVEIPKPPYYDERDSYTPFLFVKLSLSNTIETLILNGPDKLPLQENSEYLEEAMEQCKYNDPKYDYWNERERLPYHFFNTPDIPTLRRVELRGKIREDRVFRLFGVNPMSGLKQLVVPWMRETGEKAEEERREMEKVSKLCEKKGVELLFAARPPHSRLYYLGVPRLG
ncbi:hypothetical protein JCM5350_008347 [Sporobolomyces pararoseus]